MADLSDEILMAYADGELDRHEHARVEAILALTPVYQARLEVFQSTGRLLAEHYRRALEEPVPGELVRLVLNAGPAVATSSHHRTNARSIARLADRLARMLGAGVPRWQAALACSASLVIGVGAGWLKIHPAVRPLDPAGAAIALDDGQIKAQGALARALQSAPSGQLVLDSEIGEPVKGVRIRLTFRSRDQAFCREVQFTLRAGGAFAGIGCRAANGDWRMLALLPAPDHPTTAGQTTPAADSGLAALAGLVERTIDGDALGAADEAALIARHWQ